MAEKAGFERLATLRRLGGPGAPERLWNTTHPLGYQSTAEEHIGRFKRPSPPHHTAGRSPLV